MASNHTDKLGLSLWAANDAVLRADFNTDNQKLEAAYKLMPRMVVGSYTGDGAYGADSPNNLQFNFSPYLVVIAADDSTSFVPAAIFIRNQTESAGISKTSSSTDMLKLKLTWDTTTVSWYSLSDASAARDQFNEAGVTYRFFAIGLMA